LSFPMPSSLGALRESGCFFKLYKGRWQIGWAAIGRYSKPTGDEGETRYWSGQPASPWGPCGGLLR
jgi:hypothetical protein